MLFMEQREWFSSFGIEIDIVPAGGKKNMINKANKFYKIAVLQKSDHIIFLPDQNNDSCALVTRQKIGMDSCGRCITIAIKRELEAWILADGKSLRDSIDLIYEPPGFTDTELDPKQKLYALIKRKLGYFPSSIEATNLVKSYFSIERAANNNHSAARFKRFIENILSQ